MNIEMTIQQDMLLKNSIDVVDTLFGYEVDCIKEIDIDFLSSFLKSLSKDQIKQLAEDAGMYCGEWIKFDGNVKNAPKHLEDCLIKTNWAFYVAFIKTHDGVSWFETTDGKEIQLSNVTHTMKLPTFKDR